MGQLTAIGARRWADAGALVLIVGLTVIATLIGLRTGFSRLDVDEAVYRRTLLEMQSGKGYYAATRDALVAKEGRGPSQIRSVRPPTMFVLLRWVPARGWRWAVGLVFLATIVGSWRLARPGGSVAGVAAIALSGLWMMAYSPFLFLHSEVWGAPLLLAGLLAVRRGNDRAGAALIAGATFFRELFGLGLLLGLLLRPRRRPWAVGLAGVFAGALVHVALAQRILDPHGHEARFGNEHRTLRYLVDLVSPGRVPLLLAIGVVSLALGLVGLARLWRMDAAATLAFPFVAAMVGLTVWSTRVYWSAVWAPVLVAYVPSAVSRARRPC